MSMCTCLLGRSEDSFQDSGLPFCYVDPRDQIQVGLAVGTFMNWAISLALTNVFSTSSNQILHSHSVLAKAPGSGPCNTQNTNCFHPQTPQTPVTPPYGLCIRCLLFPVKHAPPTNYLTCPSVCHLLQPSHP